MDPVPRPAIATVLVATLLLLVAAMFGGLAERQERDPDLAAAVAPSFTIRGSVRGLYPGATKRLRVRVRNPFGFPIHVVQVRASVREPRPACPASTLRAPAWRGRLRIAPRGLRRVTLRVHMPASAPGACQGERYRLIYAGRAVRA